MLFKMRQPHIQHSTMKWWDRHEEEGVHLDAGLGDGNGLLLHGLVDGDLVLHIHLVKLVDAADAVVCQHQGAGLYAEIVRVGLLRTACRPCQLTFEVSSGCLCSNGRSTAAAAMQGLLLLS